MELPVFALHAVTFPGAQLTLRVFEPRYLALLDDVLPHGAFVVVAIREGREVTGPADPYRVGVMVAVEDHEVLDDGAHAVTVRGQERVALIERAMEAAMPYPRWRVERYADEGGAGTDDVAAAASALLAYLRATGEGDARPIVPREPVSASWALAAAAPGLVPARQELLEEAGAGSRLRRVREVFRTETRLVRAFGAGLAGAAGTGGSPN